MILNPVPTMGGCWRLEPYSDLLMLERFGRDSK
jgi:hypothetical protein